MAIARWKDLCIDATDAHRVAQFWGALLGLDVELHDDGDAALRGATPEETIWVNAVPEPRSHKQRVHLDLETASVDAALALGATMLLPAAESGFRWSVLRDVEGGELCAFERAGFPTEPPARLYEIGVDTVDPDRARAQAGWWSEVLGGTAGSDEGYAWLEDVPGLPCQTITFVPVPEPKATKNRIHWDITCDDLPALAARGATVLDEQPSWTVLQDPDGNEFCVFPEG